MPKVIKKWIAVGDNLKKSSAIGNHLLDNIGRAVNYCEDRFSVVARARNEFYLNKELTVQGNS